MNEPEPYRTLSVARQGKTVTVRLFDDPGITPETATMTTPRPSMVLIHGEPQHTITAEAYDRDTLLFAVRQMVYRLGDTVGDNPSARGQDGDVIAEVGRRIQADTRGGDTITLGDRE